MKIISNAAVLADAYDGFLIDLWGTLHDGGPLFPEARSFLDLLKTLEKPILFLSNAPRRVGRILQEFSLKGIDLSAYGDIFTSGEDVFETFSGPGGPSQIFGCTFFHIGSSQHNLWEGTSLRPVSFLREASFILLTGMIPGRNELSHYEDLFAEALILELPIVCANPDVSVMHAGHSIWCAGKLANIYRDSDGHVLWYGKPMTGFFEKAFRRLNLPNTKRLLMIGDGVETDIRGAINAGIDSALIFSGLLSEPCGVSRERVLRESHVARLDPQSIGHQATYGLSSLRMES